MVINLELNKNKKESILLGVVKVLQRGWNRGSLYVLSEASQFIFRVIGSDTLFIDHTEWLSQRFSTGGQWAKLGPLTIPCWPFVNFEIYRKT